MSSGAAVDPKCLEVFQELKLGKKYKYIIYKMNAANTVIEVEKTVAVGEGDYDSFVASFPADDCRWGVYDFDYNLPGGEGARSKITFYTWSADGSKIRSKMVYASSKDALRKSLNGVAVEIQGTDYDEVSYETVLERVAGK